jgi:hypothetical protein
MTSMNRVCVGLAILLGICIIWGAVHYYTSHQEGFSSLLPGNVGEARPLLADDFPITGYTGVSRDSASGIWWKYPVFKASRRQLTNNLKHVYNPDNGTCSRSEFCGAVYHDKDDVPTNIVRPLPPVPAGSGVRVGYFRAMA